jgi:hypothetical protein
MPYTTGSITAEPFYLVPPPPDQALQAANQRNVDLTAQIAQLTRELSAERVKVATLQNAVKAGTASPASTAALRDAESRVSALRASRDTAETIQAFSNIKSPSRGLSHLVIPDSGANEVYEGQIDGEFHGWDENALYKFADGHIIKQADSPYHYHYYYAYNPKVTIYKTENEKYKIIVDGDNDRDAYVEFLR